MGSHNFSPKIQQRTATEEHKKARNNEACFVVFPSTLLTESQNTESLKVRRALLERKRKKWGKFPTLVKIHFTVLVMSSMACF